MGDVTTLLMGSRRGEPLAMARLFELLYTDLRRIARARLRYRPEGSLLDTTSLVHETYLRLVEREGLELRDRGHLLAYAARAMRSVVVDLIREQRADRRGGGHVLVTLDTAAASIPAQDDQVLRVHEALEALAAVDERLVRVVEMRYFVGLEHAQIAEALGVGLRTVERDWQKARSFLYDALRD